MTASVVPLTPSSLVHKQLMMKVNRHSHDDELIFNMEDNVTMPMAVTAATTPTIITATPSIQTSLAVSLLLYSTHYR